MKDAGVRPRKVVPTVNEGTSYEWGGNKTELTENILSGESDYELWFQETIYPYAIFQLLATKSF